MTATTPVRTNRNAPGAPVKAEKYVYTTPERPSNRNNTVPGAPRKTKRCHDVINRDVINRDVIDIPFALVLFPEEDICHAPKKPRRVISEIENFEKLTTICLFPDDADDSQCTDIEPEEDDGYDTYTEPGEDGYYSDSDIEPLFLYFSSDDE
jgi:hypothetical protein